MSTARSPLLIPSETQVREFEAKLLLACVAAERGFPVVLGSRYDIHLRIASLPTGIYIAKDVRDVSVRMFEIMRKLGHRIVAWDEEGLVRYTPEHYFESRIDPTALDRVTAWFAWGQEDADLIRRCPSYNGIPIHVTGNPRVDLMRPEFLPFYDEEVEGIRRRFGRPILLNTNFAHLNHYVPELSSYRPDPEWRPASEGDDFISGLAVHRNAIFSHFLKLVRQVAEAFPDQTLVVRPHPAENHGPWIEAARGCDNVHVVYEGSVTPWLMACRALLHNGCTTAIEASILGVPAIAFCPVVSEQYDRELPDSLSLEAPDFDGVRAALAAILDGEIDARADEGHRNRIGRAIAALDGPLASDRIVDVLEGVDAPGSRAPAAGLADYASGWVHARIRGFVKEHIHSRVPGHKNSADYQSHRFPGVSLPEVETGIRRLQERLGRFAGVRARSLGRNVFEIVA